MRDARRQPTQARHNQSTRRDSGLSCRNMEILLALNLSLRNDLRAFGSRYLLPPPTPAPHRCPCELLEQLELEVTVARTRYNAITKGLRPVGCKKKEASRVEIGSSMMITGMREHVSANNRCDTRDRDFPALIRVNGSQRLSVHFEDPPQDRR